MLISLVGRASDRPTRRVQRGEEKSGSGRPTDRPSPRPSWDVHRCTPATEWCLAGRQIFVLGVRCEGVRVSKTIKAAFPKGSPTKASTSYFRARQHWNLRADGRQRGNGGKTLPRRYHLSETRAGPVRVPHGFRSNSNVLVTSHHCYHAVARFLGDSSASLAVVGPDSPW